MKHHKDTSISEFVRTTIDQIQAGLPEGYVIDEVIEFEISVVSNKQSDGKIDVKVLSLNNEYSSELVQKISFSVINSKQKELNAESEHQTLVKNLSQGIQEIIKLGQNP